MKCVRSLFVLVLVYLTAPFLLPGHVAVASPSFSPVFNVSHYLLEGLALSSDNSTAYVAGVISFGNSQGGLFAVNLSSGVGSQVYANSSYTIVTVALNSANTVAYFIGYHYYQTTGGCLIAVNLSTGSDSTVYYNASSALLGLALNSANTIAYVTTATYGSSYSGSLLAVQLNTGVATTVFSTSLCAPQSVALNAANTMAYIVGTGYAGSHGCFLAVNLTTGATLFTNTSFTYALNGVALNAANTIAYVVGSGGGLGYTGTGAGAGFETVGFLLSVNLSTGIVTSLDFPTGGVYAPQGLAINSAQTILYLTGSTIGPLAEGGGGGLVATALPSTSPLTAAVSSSSISSSPTSASSSSSGRAVSSSATSTAAATSAPSTPARVVGDPMFVGFLQQRYQVHGLDGGVYNLLSQPSLSINALFVFLHSGVCPEVDGAILSNCWSHPGSYFGALGIQTAPGDTLEIRAGSATHGFDAVRLVGERVRAVKGVRVDGLALSFTFSSTHSMTVLVDNYRLVIENDDGFLNVMAIEVLDWQHLVAVDRPHGLLGQSWAPSKKPRTGQVMAVRDVAEGVEEDDFLIASTSIFGTDFVYNRFSATV